MYATFNTTAWLVQTALIFIAFLLTVPVLRTTFGFFILIVARIFTSPHSKLQKAGVRVLPRYVRALLGVTIGVSGLIATPALATESIQIDRISTLTTAEQPPVKIDTEQVTESAQPISKGYLVAAGDSLWRIAATLLVANGKNPTAAEIDQTWREIWKINFEAIGTDPSLIKPGQHLALPESLQK